MEGGDVAEIEVVVADFPANSGPRLARLDRMAQRKQMILERFRTALQDVSAHGSSASKISAGMQEIRQIMNVHVQWLGEKRIKKAINLLKWVLSKHDFDSKVYENALWALCNLSCESKQMAHLANSDKEYRMIDKVAGYVSDKYPNNVREQAVWTLSNYAADCEECRLQVRGTKILMKLCRMLQEAPVELTKRRSLIVWSMRNYVRPLLEPSNVDPLFMDDNEFDHFINVLANELISTNSQEIKFEGVHCIMGIIENDRRWAEKVGFNDEVLSIIIDYMSLTDDIPGVAIKIIGTLGRGSDHIVENIYKHGFIAKLLSCFDHFPNGIKYIALWALSNLLATFDSSITLNVVKKNEILVDRIMQLCYDYDFDIRIEAIMCLLNMAAVCVDQDYNDLLMNGAAFIFYDYIKDCTEEKKFADSLYHIATHICDRIEHKDPFMLEAAKDIDYNSVIRKKMDIVRDNRLLIILGRIAKCLSPNTFRTY